MSMQVSNAGLYCLLAAWWEIKMQLSVSLYSQVSSAELTYIQAWVAQCWQWRCCCTHSSCTCQPHCRHQQHDNLPRSLSEVPSTQNTEIRQSWDTLIKALRNLTCREQRLHCIALTLAWWSTSTKAATLDGKGCIMPIRIALLTPLTYRSLYWEEVHSGQLTTGHLTHRHLPTAHFTSDNSFVI